MCVLCMMYFLYNCTLRVYHMQSLYLHISCLWISSCPRLLRCISMISYLREVTGLPRVSDSEIVNSLVRNGSSYVFWRLRILMSTLVNCIDGHLFLSSGFGEIPKSAKAKSQLVLKTLWPLSPCDSQDLVVPFVGVYQIQWAVEKNCESC